MQVVRSQPKLAEVYVKETVDREFKLQLRALDDSLMESNRLNKLVSLACLEPGQLSCQTSESIHMRPCIAQHPVLTQACGGLT